MDSQFGQHIDAELTADAVARLRASEELNRRLVEALPCGVVHVSAAGVILAANGEARRILGQTSDTPARRLVSDFEGDTVFEDGTPCHVESYPVSKALATGQEQPPMTIGVRRPDGTLAWAVFTAVPVLDPTTREVAGAVATFTDISARKRIERALRESEATLRSVLESAPNMILSADVDGRILFVNHPVPPMTAEDVRGKSLYEFVAPEDVARVRACVAGVLATGRIDAYEIRSPAPLGARSYSVSVGPILVGDEPAGVTMVTWDITERRALEAQLAISDRLASIGTLVAGVAHEINNPLMYLFGNLQILRRGLAATSEAAPLRAALDAASEGAARIRDVVRDLTSVSREGDRELVAVDVHELLESAIRMVQGHLRRRASVTRDFGCLPEAFVSSARLGQVFMNLLLNAAQAIPEGNVDANDVRVSTRLSDGMLVVEVADTGEGIAPDLIDRVFDPFLTTKSSGGGTGLGLHICRNIVVAAGGTISVRSTVGVGTVFSLRLPLATCAAGARTAGVPAP